MEPRRKYAPPRANTVYRIDGVSFGLDERLAEALQGAVLARLRAGTLEIPQPPHVAMRVLQLSESPDSSIEDVTDVVKTDPALAARLLSLANSAAYGGSATASSLEQGLSRIGMKAVNDLVFAESLRSGAFATKTHRAVLERAWRLSMGCAVACDVLARATGLERESAFLVGLLHEIGTPTLVHIVAEYARENHGRVLEGETVEIVLNQLHEEIGAHVLKQWSMPKPVVDAAGGHHRYRRDGTLAEALCFAGNRICQHLGIGGDGGEVNFPTEHVFVALKLADRELMAEILDQVSAGIEALTPGVGGTDVAKAA